MRKKENKPDFKNCGYEGWEKNADKSYCAACADAIFEDLVNMGRVRKFLEKNNKTFLIYDEQNTWCSKGIDPINSYISKNEDESEITVTLTEKKNGVVVKRKTLTLGEFQEECDEQSFKRSFETTITRAPPRLNFLFFKNKIIKNLVKSIQKEKEEAYSKGLRDKRCYVYDNIIRLLKKGKKK